MPLGTPGRAQEPIHVVPMALALALAAFAGGALGLVWHNLSNRLPAPAAEEPAEEPDETPESAAPASAPPAGS